MNVTGWQLNGQSPIRDYVDPQWQFVGNAGWTKGSHNVKFGLDYIILRQDHYETQAQSFTFDGGVTDDSRRCGGQQLQPVRVVSARAAVVENGAGDDAADWRRCVGRVALA